MGRAWFLGAAAIGALTGVLFAAFPHWDIRIVAWFWDPTAGQFPLAAAPLPNLIRDIARWSIWLISIAVPGVLLAKLVFPRRRMLIRPSIALFLLCSHLAGPGLVTSTIKPHWGRPRPVQIAQFAGPDQFEPWWRPASTCSTTCSFVSGDASHAFWLLAPASVLPGPARPLALMSVTVAASGLSAMRVAFGRHFLTDVVFAGVLTTMVIVLCRFVFVSGLLKDDWLERRLEWLVLVVRFRLARSAGVGVQITPSAVSSSLMRRA